jgi:pyrroloquinoline-quinone synthase
MDTMTLIGSHRLLEHPFYRRWEAGQLSGAELALYAEQYRHFEAQLPSFLEGLSDLVDGQARALVEANLADEVGDEVTHLALFEDYAESVGAGQAAATPAMAALVALYAEVLRRGDGAYGVGVLLGYEVQAADVAASKGEALLGAYGLAPRACRFWQLHAELEVEHAAWSLRAAEGLDESTVTAGARASAAAWWAFLDEREALVAA